MPVNRLFPRSRVVNIFACDAGEGPDDLPRAAALDHRQAAPGQPRVHTHHAHGTPFRYEQLFESVARRGDIPVHRHTATTAQ